MLENGQFALHWCRICLFCLKLLNSGAADYFMKQRKILVVDDDRIILKTLTFRLKGGGYEVLTAADGSAAVSLVRRERPDLILLDITFPPDVAHGGGVAWNGFQIIQWLHRLEEANGIPIIVITGVDSAEHQDRALAAGAVAFFHKPINHDELLDAIHRTLGENSSEASVTAP